MKKLMVFIFAAIMAISFAGTAAAQTTVELKNVINDANMRVAFPMVYSTMSTGASAYLVTNEYSPDGTWNPTGTTIFGISNEGLNAAGTEMLAIELTALDTDSLAGTTPIGGPQLLSGTTTNMILYVLSQTAVADTTATAGATLYRIAGGPGAETELEIGVPFTGFEGRVGASGANQSGNALENTLSGQTQWCIAPVTLEWDAATSAASVFGVSGTTLASTGVSIWRRSSGDLAAPGATGTTVFNQASGVSAVYASPVISGNSLFIVANYHVAGAAIATGISIFQFDKGDFSKAMIGADAIACGAGLNSANVIEPADATLAAISVAQITPTPCAQSEGTSGGTIYVVPWQGGVTVYDTQDLTQLFAYDFLNGDTSGVTASPVCNDTKLLISWASSVSGFETKNANGGVSLVFQHDFDEAANVANNTYQINSTPVISNGYAYVTVTDTTSADAATIWRFNLDNSYNGAPAVVTNKAEIWAGPIVVGGNLWFSTYNPIVEKVADSDHARGYNYWAQYKFDAAKTGHNTKPDETVSLPGSSGGCFISTIK